MNLGITWIDTAAVYGFGHAETIVGRAIRGNRHNITLATKGGLVWDPGAKAGLGFLNATPVSSAVTSIAPKVTARALFFPRRSVTRPIPAPLRKHSGRNTKDRLLNKPISAAAW